MSWWGAVALAAALLLGPATSGMAMPEDAVIPVEQYSTDKAKNLAVTYRAQLIQFSDHVYHCLPWLGVVKDGIGFRQPRGADSDERYLSVWISIEQSDDGRFGKLSQERRVSAMFSRYGVDMLRRMTQQLPSITSDADVSGFSVVSVSLKKKITGSDKALVTETLALFDGKNLIGRVPLDVWEDNFNSTFKLKNYELAKGKKC